MAPQVFEMIVKAIFANVQTKPIVGMSGRSFGNSVIAKHGNVTAVDPGSQPNRTCPIQKLKCESLQGLFGAAIAADIAVGKE